MQLIIAFIMLLIMPAAADDLDDAWKACRPHLVLVSPTDTGRYEDGWEQCPAVQSEITRRDMERGEVERQQMLDSLAKMPKGRKF